MKRLKGHSYDETLPYSDRCFNCGDNLIVAIQDLRECPSGTYGIDSSSAWPTPFERKMREREAAKQIIPDERWQAEVLDVALSRFSSAVRSRSRAFMGLPVR